MNYAQPPMMPVAKALANQGRMSDSTLVHMNPQEVAGLQSLARQNGTSLTINPQTGLPEAFNLGSVLPMVAGAALTPVLGPMAPLVVGGLGALATGSLEQGIMMGLGAYGGAGLATNLAGTAANLAAPAAAAPTIGAEAAAAELAAANAAAQAATTQAAAAANIAPPVDISGNVLGVDEMASLTGGQGVSAGFPTSVPKPPVSGLGKFFEPDENVTYENIGKGLKNVFSSGENAMDFLGENKMNLAMSAAPMLIPETPEEIERRRAMIRPYDYEVENLTGTDVDPFGTEAERLRGRFVARDPYYAAQGGLMSLAEGGSTSGDSSIAAPSTAETSVMARIAAMQQAAGIPMGMPGIAPTDAYSGIAALPSMFALPPAAPRPPVAYTPSMVGNAPVLDTSERRYVGTPGTSTVESSDFASSLPLEKANRLSGTPLEGVAATFNRAFGNKNYYSGPPRSILGYTSDGKPVYLSSDNEGGFASSSSRNKFSYDPATGTYKQFAEGGSVAEGSSTTAAPTTAAPTQTLTPAQAEVFRNIMAVQQMMGAPSFIPTTPAAPSAGLATLPSMFAPAAPRPPVAYTPSMVGTTAALDTSEKRYTGTPGASNVVQSSENPFSSLPLEDTSVKGILMSEGMPGLIGAVFKPMMETGWKAANPFGPDPSNLRKARRIIGYSKSGEPIYLAADAKGGTVSGASSNKFSYDPATGTYRQLAQGGLTSLKAGGLREGAFIVPADVISHLGNGSSEAGMRIVQERLKGRPIKGPGDGMSDSIPTTIAGKQPARVANEEAEIPPEVVAALGGGSLEVGAKKLYEMMDKIRKDRTGKKKQAPAVKADKYMPA